MYRIMLLSVGVSSKLVDYNRKSQWSLLPALVLAELPTRVKWFASTCIILTFTMLESDW